VDPFFKLSVNILEFFQIVPKPKPHYLKISRIEFKPAPMEPIKKFFSVKIMTKCSLQNEELANTSKDLL
jgi:hypothetical protein